MGKYLDYIMVAVCLLTMIIYNSYVILRYKKVPVFLSETAYMIGGEKSLKRYCYIFGNYLFHLNPYIGINIKSYL